jgi:hypothetical protein
VNPRIYTYRIKFSGTPYFYWGAHKEKRYGEEYLGSPVTNRWAWDFYYVEKEILEYFPYTEEGWKEANSVERRIILPDLNNPFCLNEGCGGTVSSKVCRENGRKVTKVLVEQKRGMYNDDPEYLKERNTKNASKRTKEGLARGGSAALKKSIERNPNHQSEAGKKGGLKGGAKTRELGVGICGISTEERRARGKEVAAQKWKCLVTGHISAAGPLTLWQRKRGIDTSLRVKLDGNG